MKEKNVVQFFLITFLWTWILWAPFVLAGLGLYTLDEDLSSVLSLPVFILGAFGPAVGAIFSVFRQKGTHGLKVFAKSFLSLRFGWKVWTAIFFGIGIVNATAWYVPELFGQDRVNMLLTSLFIFFIYWLIMVFLGGGQEEIGWRGYALPILEARYGLWVGNIVLGLVWALWHVPLYFMSGHTKEYLPFFPFVIGCIGVFFFYSWVIKASESRPLSGLIAHGTFNAFIPVFPTIIMDGDVFSDTFLVP